MTRRVPEFGQHRRGAATDLAAFGQGCASGKLGRIVELGPFHRLSSYRNICRRTKAVPDSPRSSASTISAGGTDLTDVQEHDASALTATTGYRQLAVLPTRFRKSVNVGRADGLLRALPNDTTARLNAEGVPVEDGHPF
ncbi:hypothetical protein [Streptomyces sp. NPDC005438]|uniref:hypothetical protein n=1 Tax=Streptomyces sp. NPDC005438 TaxID=3156880 RepID=UPI0033B16C13